MIKFDKIRFDFSIAKYQSMFQKHPTKMDQTGYFFFLNNELIAILSRTEFQNCDFYIDKFTGLSQIFFSRPDPVIIYLSKN